MRRPRWFELVPEAVTGLGLLWFLVDEPDAATSALASPRAIALMVTAGGVWLAARVAAARWVRPAAVRTVGFLVLGAVVLVAVVLPAYDEDTVVEALPHSPATTALTTASAAALTAEATTTTTTTPVAGVAASPTTAVTRRPATTTSTTASAPEPTRLRSGELTGIDHRASGTAAIYRQPDGRFVVGLEDFDIQPGPDYDLYVVPGKGRRDIDGGTRLGDLRGNQGTQYDDVPSGLDLSDGQWTVLVWCQRFSVPVAHATPR